MLEVLIDQENKFRPLKNHFGKCRVVQTKIGVIFEGERGFTYKNLEA